MEWLSESMIYSDDPEDDVDLVPALSSGDGDQGMTYYDALTPEEHQISTAPTNDVDKDPLESEEIVQPTTPCDQDMTDLFSPFNEPQDTFDNYVYSDTLQDGLDDMYTGLYYTNERIEAEPRSVKNISDKFNPEKIITRNYFEHYYGTKDKSLEPESPYSSLETRFDILLDHSAVNATELAQLSNPKLTFDYYATPSKKLRERKYNNSPTQYTWDSVHDGVKIAIARELIEKVFDYSAVIEHLRLTPRQEEHFISLCRKQAEFERIQQLEAVPWQRGTITSFNVRLGAIYDSLTSLPQARRALDRGGKFLTALHTEFHTDRLGNSFSGASDKLRYPIDVAIRYDECTKASIIRYFGEDNKRPSIMSIFCRFGSEKESDSRSNKEGSDKEGSHEKDGYNEDSDEEGSEEEDSLEESHSLRARFRFSALHPFEISLPYRQERTFDQLPVEIEREAVVQSGGKWRPRSCAASIRGDTIVVQDDDTPLSQYSSYSISS